MAVMRRSVIFTDHSGGVTIFAIRTSSGATGIQLALIAKSHGDYLNFWESTETVNVAPATSSGQYPSVTQQATLSYLCADGTVARLVIPAPDLSIFLADGQTVDATQIAALTAACIGNLAAPSQSLAVSFLGGFLTRRNVTL